MRKIFQKVSIYLCNGRLECAQPINLPLAYIHVILSGKSLLVVTVRNRSSSLPVDDDRECMAVIITDTLYWCTDTIYKTIESHQQNFINLYIILLDKQMMVTMIWNSTSTLVMTRPRKPLHPVLSMSLQPYTVYIDRAWHIERLYIFVFKIHFVFRYTLRVVMVETKL